MECSLITIEVPQRFKENQISIDLSQDKLRIGLKSWAKDVTNVTKHKRFSGQIVLSFPKFYSYNLNDKDMRQFCTKLLSDSDFFSDKPAADRSTLHKVEAKFERLGSYYKDVMKDYLIRLDKIQTLKLENLKYIDKTEKQFYLLSQATTHINLLSWTSDFILMSFLPIIWRLWGKSCIVVYLIPGYLTVYGSLIASYYANFRAGNIERSIWREKDYLNSLHSLYQRGNCVDEIVENLFPYGIDQNLINQIIIETGGNFESQLSWKFSICLIIIVSNIRHNEKLMRDTDFLMTVKLFVESPAAQIWWKRMVMQKLMDNIPNEKWTWLKVFSSHRTKSVFEEDLHIFRKHVVVSFLNVLIPVIVLPQLAREIKIITSFSSAIMAVFDLMVSKENKFRDLSRMAEELQGEYCNVEKVSTAINSDKVLEMANLMEMYNK